MGEFQGVVNIELQKVVKNVEKRRVKKSEMQKAVSKNKGVL
jgi:hypothetical protein